MLEGGRLRWEEGSAWGCGGSPSVGATGWANVTWHTCARQVAAAVVPSVMSLATVCGNFLVLVAVARTPKLRRKLTSVLICNLALADLLVGLVVMPLAVSQIVTTGFWPFPRLLCRVWISLDVICCTASILSLCVISLDRFFGVLYPMQYQVFVTRWLLMLAALVIWLFSLGVLLATFRWHRPLQLAAGVSSRQNICHVADELKYVTHSVVLSFFLPLCVILVVYWKIYKVTKKREMSLIQSMVMNMRLTGPAAAGLPVGKAGEANGVGEDLSSPVHQRRKSRIPSLFKGGLNFPGLRMHYGTTAAAAEGEESEASKKRRFYLKHKKSAKTLGIVVGVFLLSWLPFFLLYLIDHFTGSVPGILLEIFTWLGYTNSAMNPVIYCVTVKAFRQAFKDLLSCGRLASSEQNRSRTFFNTEGRDSQSRIRSTLRQMRASLKRGSLGRRGKRRSGIEEEVSSGSSASLVASLPHSSKRLSSSASGLRQALLAQPPTRRQSKSPPPPALRKSKSRPTVEPLVVKEAEGPVVTKARAASDPSPSLSLKLYRLLVADKETEL